jgi:hypothetical protein
VHLETGFEGAWDALLAQASRWMDATDIEPEGRAAVGRHLQKLAPAVIKPRQDWLQESYLVFDLHEIQGETGTALTADELLTAHGDQIAQLIRGKQNRLARTTTERVLQGSVSYSPTDLLVVGSSAALVYDRPDEAVWTIQILEYAKMQLLEFRYYDNFMTRVLNASPISSFADKDFSTHHRDSPRDITCGHATQPSTSAPVSLRHKRRSDRFAVGGSDH